MPGQALPYGALPLWRTDDEQEPATAGAGQLGARGARIERPATAASIWPFDTPDASFRLASQLSRTGPDRVHVAVAQPVDSEPREVAEEVELRPGDFDVRVLLGQDRVRAPGDAGVEEHDLLLEGPCVAAGSIQFGRPRTSSPGPKRMSRIPPSAAMY